MTEVHESGQDLAESSSVRVAVRIRPFLNKELVESPQTCIGHDPEHNSVVLGKDRQFEFDRVFGVEAKQVEIFDYCVKDLVLSCFSGYNATVLAYGQTGSGKTYTMGSGQRINVLEEELGIIPRVITYIIDEIEKRKDTFEFILKVSFLEIYNEELHDLLDPKPGADKQITIREDRGAICLMGMHEEKVTTFEEMGSCLDRGSLNRSTAATLMNELSSRSHAIFTISIEQHAIEETVEGEPLGEEAQGYMCAKFHFVDLAGSERAKRTGASGTTMKEGISINKGLLCLGNVISALTEDSKKAVHVPYRDSKLTRILQDSLGGNSKTCMIACVSPAEINFEETHNTLKYASRARHIKNKPVVNRDPNSALIAQLRQEIFHLKGEVKAYQRVIATGDLSEVSAKGMSAYQDEDEVRQLKLTCQQLDKKVLHLITEVAEKEKSLESQEIKILAIQRDRDIAKTNLERATGELKARGVDFVWETESALTDEYIATIADLRNQLKEKDLLIRQFSDNFESLRLSNERDLQILRKKTQELDQIRREKTYTDPSEAVTLQVEQSVISSISDYGKLFAASILETIEHGTEGQGIEGEQDPELEVSLEKQESEIHNIEGTISQKEEMLKSIEETLHEMQQKLVAEMNQQYHRKISELEQELRALERDKEIAVSKLSSASEKKVVEDRYRSQIQQLEEKLRDNKKKDREQTALYKTLDTQKTQISKLAEEIQKAKQQKMLLVKKHKTELETYQKWKSERTKELLFAKKLNLKKDQQIAKLLQDGKKKENVAKRKAEELISLQKRQKEIIGKLKGKGTEDLEVLRRWVSDFMQACLIEKSTKEKLAFESTEQAEIVAELAHLRDTATTITLKLDRLQLEYHSPSPSASLQDLSQEIQTLEQGKRELEDQLESLEVKLRFKQEKVEELLETLSQCPLEDIRTRCTTLRTLADAQNLISVLFEELVKSMSFSKQLELNLRRSEVDLEVCKAQIKTVVQEKEVAILEHHRAVERLKAELRDKEMRWLEEMKTQDHIIVPVEPPEDCALDKRCEDLEAKLLEKELAIENLRKKLEVVTGKLNQLRKPVGDQKESASEKRPPAGFTSLAKARESKLRNKKTDEEDKTHSAGRESPQRTIEQPQSRNPGQNAGKQGNKWVCVQTTDAHSAPVSALCFFENVLYTASNKSFKVWSADSMSPISEIPAHSSYIRAMTLWTENRLIMTGSQGTIIIWDTVSLQSAAVLEKHNDEVRTMKIYENYLITGGKSTDSYSVFVWDLRRSQRPIAEMEPRNEIAAMTVIDDVLFYGGRDKTIHRVNLSTFEPLETIPNAHSDTISGLGTFPGNLVSSSYDKTVKSWSPETNAETGVSLSAHSDAILTLEDDFESQSVFTCGKDGKIKQWNAGLSCIGELQGHRGAVNCLSVIKPGESVVSGAGDKCVKLWRVAEDEV